MERLDLRKELKHLYSPSVRVFAVLDVPPMNFLMIDGHGDPNAAQEYQDALQTLYALAYTLKFGIKKGQGVDYPVMALEGLWWAEQTAAFSLEQRSDWLWTMMIMQPDLVTPELVAAAVEEARAKRNPPALDKVRYERFHEGLAVQIMYIGAYRDEGPTIAAMHEFIRANGYLPAGKHHEIYLGDPRRTAPEKLKTVLRQPVRLP